MKKKVICVFSAILALFTVMLSFSSCTSESSDNLKYKEAENGYALYRYEGASTEKTFTVPDTYNDKPVTELMSFCISNSEYLEVLNIGENIEKIDPWALTNCPVLKAINVNENNKYFTSVDGVLYSKDMTKLIAYPNGKTPLVTDKDGKVTGGGTIKLPETVKVIGENAFYMCSNLYSIEFNQGLEKVENKAFLKCTNLSALEFPETLTEIGVDSFSYCDSLTHLEIPSSVKSIGDYAFFSTSSSIDKIVVHQPNADSLTLGKDWIPNKKNNVREKVTVEYTG